jgi:prolyl-tRNA editing enzyme YbaK/EbsC (Cys-tRNA(Pro) deacylase)
MPDVPSARFVPSAEPTHYAASMSLQDPPAAVQRVEAAFAALGCPGEAQPLTAVRDRIGGVDGESLANSHLFHVGDHHCLVLVLAGRRVDPVNLGSVLGEMDVAEMTDGAAAEWTGQLPGGIAPLATAEPNEVIVDIDLAKYARIWVPAGHPDWVFGTNYAQLLRITAGSAAEVGELPIRPRPPTMQT